MQTLRAAQLARPRILVSRSVRMSGMSSLVEDAAAPPGPRIYTRKDGWRVWPPRTPDNSWNGFVGNWHCDIHDPKEYTVVQTLRTWRPRDASRSVWDQTNVYSAARPGSSLRDSPADGLHQKPFEYPVDRTTFDDGPCRWSLVLLYSTHTGELAKVTFVQEYDTHADPATPHVLAAAAADGSIRTARPQLNAADPSRWLSGGALNGKLMVDESLQELVTWGAASSLPSTSLLVLPLPDSMYLRAPASLKDLRQQQQQQAAVAGSVAAFEFGGLLRSVEGGLQRVVVRYDAAAADGGAASTPAGGGGNLTPAAPRRVLRKLPAAAAAAAASLATPGCGGAATAGCEGAGMGGCSVPVLALVVPVLPAAADAWSPPAAGAALGPLPDAAALGWGCGVGAGSATGGRPEPDAPAGCGGAGRGGSGAAAPPPLPDLRAQRLRGGAGRQLLVLAPVPQAAHPAVKVRRSLAAIGSAPQRYPQLVAFEF
eukprot:XP_001699894.1 predicted protein [Chlamydomonas reinhardtii]